ncbi:hypothetical protein GW846_05735 [Candidatus Gracilibacteria bacterium]|nr:hypothetical protein [Candidatus Gracilibacteria bacterium]
MKTIFALLALGLLLVSCGGADENEDNLDTTITTDNGTIITTDDDVVID